MTQPQESGLVMNKTKGYIVVYDPGDESYGTYSDEVFVTEPKKYSRLLGPDGNRLPYQERQSFGFNLKSSK